MKYILQLLIFVSVMLLSSDVFAARWYKCAWHVHSLVSDGDDFPDMIASYYKDAGYDCVIMTEHDKIASNTLWIGEPSIVSRAGSNQPIVDYVTKFPQWAQKKVSGNSWAWRLWSINEINSHIGTLGVFWVFGGEEISGGDSKLFLHENGFNHTVVQPTPGLDPVSVLDGSAALARAKPAVANAPVFVAVNHPNDTWAVTVPTLVALNNVRALEIYNGLTRSNTHGDIDHPSAEALWDEANTQRILMGKRLLLGIGGDDAHRYAGRGGNASAPMKVALMIRADGLTTGDLARALDRGDFYPTTGVQLIDPSIDAGTCRYTFSTSFPVSVEVLATLRHVVDESCPCMGSEGPSGEIIYAISGVTSMDYVPPSNAIIVRLRIKSDDPVWFPLKQDEVQTAWLQPCAL